MFILERYEGEVAVIENSETGEFVNVNKSELAENTKEGDVLVLVNGEYKKDEEATINRRKHIKSLYRKVTGK